MSHQGHNGRLMEVTDPDRDLFSCMRGEYGFLWYALSWMGALTLPTLAIVAVLTVVT
jgi:hypothetical protein